MFVFIFILILFIFSTTIRNDLLQSEKETTTTTKTSKQREKKTTEISNNRKEKAKIVHSVSLLLDELHKSFQQQQSAFENILFVQ